MERLGRAARSVVRAVFLLPADHGVFVRQNDLSEKRVSRRIDIWSRNHAVRATLVATVLLLDILAFAWGFAISDPRALQTPAIRLAVRLAKGSARLLSFNIALVFLTACRCLLTALRAARFHKFDLPLNDIPACHRVLGLTIAAAALVHTVAHLACLGLRGGKALNTAWAPYGVFLATGAALVVTVALLGVAPARRLRASATGMRVFSATHAPAAVVLILLLMAHSTLPLVAIVTLPALLYCLDVLLRYRSKLHRDVPVASCHANAADRFVRLEVCRPNGFVFQAGQFVYLNIPAISGSEFHPFTIASAPENPTLVFFIRNAGQWTSKLFEHAKDCEAQDLVACIRGPFGAPCQDVTKYQNVVLIASGIGITPMKSIYDHLANMQGEDCRKGLKESGVVVKPLEAQTDLSSSRLLALLPGSSFGLRRTSLHSDLSRGERYSLLSSRASLVGATPSTGVAAGKFRTSANNWLRGAGFNLAFSWLALAGLAVVLQLLIFKRNQRTVVSIILAWTCSQTILLLTVIASSVVGFGRRYILTQFVLVDAVPLIPSVAVLGSALVYLIKARGSWLTSLTLFFAAEILHLVRFILIVHVARTWTTFFERSWSERRRFDANDRGRHSIHLIWVTRTLAGAQWLISETDKTSDHCRAHFSATVFLSQEHESVVQEYEKTRQHPHARIKIGRPNWDETLEKHLNINHQATRGSPLGVFFCGSRAIGSDIRRTALEVDVRHCRNALQTNLLSESCGCGIEVHEENF